MFRNMAASLFRYEQIRTTVPKAKELRRYIEPLITIAKKDTVANRRIIFARLGNNKKATTKLDFQTSHEGVDIGLKDDIKPEDDTD